jgi:hypothetical protein
MLSLVVATMAAVSPVVPAGLQLAGTVEGSGAAAGFGGKVVVVGVVVGGVELGGGVDVVVVGASLVGVAAEAGVIEKATARSAAVETTEPRSTSRERCRTDRPVVRPFSAPIAAAPLVHLLWETAT